MKVYLVASSSLHIKVLLEQKCENILISYYCFGCTKDKRSYHDILCGDEKKQELDKGTKSLLKQFKNVMVDSGAFSFMSGKETKTRKKDVDKFVEGYGRWLRNNKGYYDSFEEMDLDFLFPINVIEGWREFLEKCAGKKCLPVWHINRGLDYWEMMVRDYDYIAIGGLVSGEITEMEKYASFLIDIAHKNGCKVHGLGYTKTKLLKYIPWDSVDSLSWARGGISGRFQYFNGENILSPELNEFNKNSRINYIDFYNINAQSWCAYAKYIEDYWNRQKGGSLVQKGGGDAYQKKTGSPTPALKILKKE